MSTRIYGYWVSPDSKVYPILDDFGHKKMIESLLGISVDSTDDIENSLFTDGWIRIVNTEKTLMINYKCVTSRDQLRVLEEIDNQLIKDGYLHENYILDYGYDYHFFESMKELLRRIKERI